MPEDNKSKSVEFEVPIDDELPNREEKQQLERYLHLSDFLNPLSYGYYGRKDIFEKLHSYIQDNSKSVICIHGFAEEGKSSLVFHFVTQIANKQYYGAKYIFYWCFKPRNSNVSDFFETVLRFFDKDRINTNSSDDNERAEKLINFLNANKCILILDGIETLQYHENTEDGDIYDKSIKMLIINAARNGFSHGACIIAISHKCINELRYFPTTTENIKIPPIGALESLEIFKEYEIKGEKEELIDVAKERKFHPLTLILLARIIQRQFAGDIKFKNSINLIKDFENEQHRRTSILNNLEDLFDYYDNLWEENSDEQIILLLLSIFRGAAEKKELIYLIESSNICKSIASKSLVKRMNTFNLLKQYGLVINCEGCFDTHALIREHYYDIFKTQYPEEFVFCNKVLANYYLRNLGADTIEYLSDMDPLYNAVYFLTQSGDYKMALEIFWERICRGREFFSQKILGAYSKDYFVISQFFNTKNNWKPYATDISETDIAWLYSVAAYLLNNLGSLSESEKLRKLDIAMHKKLGNIMLVASDI